MTSKFSQKNILVVDDVPENVRLLSQSLKAQGYSVRGVTTGEMALRVAQSNWPSLILLDIRMPKMDGFQVCEALKTQSSTRNIPVIFLTALEESLDKIRAFSAGGADYITKPFEIEEVIARVEHQLNLQSAQAEINNLNQNLESKVRERTAQLEQANSILTKEIKIRQQTEEALKQAHQRLAFHVENSPLGVLEWDNNMRLRRWSQQSETIFGWSTEEVIGKSWQDWKFIVESDLEKVNEVSSRLLRGEESRNICLNQNYCKNGTTVYCEWYNSALLDAKGQLISILSLVHDISDRQRVTAALKASQERFELAVRGSGDGLWDWNPITNEVYYSCRFKEILGYQEHEFTNHFDSWVDHLHPDERLSVLEALYEHLYHSSSYDIEYRLRTKFGEYRWIRARGQAIWNESGQATRMAGSIGDITPLKEAQSALYRTNQELERRVVQRTAELTRSNQELENFAYIVSHDLQEPLRKMKSFSQLLAKECQGQFTENEKAQRYLDYIIDAAGRQRNMIQALLNYSRLGRNDSPKVFINLNAVIEKVIEDLSISIAETQTTVTVSKLPTVEASATQMAQLFLNLIRNGIKFQGEAPPRIQIEAELQSSEWLISVQDNGIGLKPKYAERIFQIFQRLHSRSEYPGTGIGLAICRKIVEDHGGRIWVDSEPGQGSTFYFTLPVSPSLS